MKAELKNIYDGTKAIALKDLPGLLIKKGDEITFLRSNNWDRCFFKDAKNNEFKIWCSNPLSFFEKDKFKITHLEGNPYDENYMQFIKENPKFIVESTIELIKNKL